MTCRRSVLSTTRGDASRQPLLDRRLVEDSHCWSGELTRMARTALDESRFPKYYWPLALAWASDALNIINGAVQEVREDRATSNKEPVPFAILATFWNTNQKSINRVIKKCCQHPKVFPGSRLPQY
eukprot:Lankesteria_metandrocarpae@DN4287_c0_g1_i2.p1